jgi:hypothetical protein
MNATEPTSLDTSEREAARIWLIRLAIIAGVIATWTDSPAGYVIGGLLLIAAGAGAALIRKPSRVSQILLRNAKLARSADLASALGLAVIGVYLVVEGLS